MAKLKDRLKRLDSTIQKKWQGINEDENLSTKQKLEKLVSQNLKREKITKEPEPQPKASEPLDPFIVREFSYPLDSYFGKLPLSAWKEVTSQVLTIVSGEEEFQDVEPMKLLFFDTETTGLSGGTGTIPFMLGFGFFEGEQFSVKIFILNDLSAEEAFLDAVDQFFDEYEFSGVVTYNGKAFDFPLMETRYILYRKRFPLLRKPHLDFLFPARMIWRNTYESRRLGFLGEVLLGISRTEDVDGSQIPALYFSYLRGQNYRLIEKVIEHNSLDLSPGCLLDF